MRQLLYSRNTSLILHNEDYTNAGLEQDEMIEAIKNIYGVYSVKKFPLNSNIEVFISGHSQEFIASVMIDIRRELERLVGNE